MQWSLVQRALGKGFLATAGLQVTLFATGIALARGLGPTDRGYFGYLSVIAAIAWLVAPLGLPYAMSFVLAEYRDSRAIKLVELR